MLNQLHIDPIRLWIYALIIVGIIGGIATGIFKARKIQPKGFKWKVFRNEIIFATINVSLSVVLLGWPSTWLKTHGYIHYQTGSAPFWVLALEYAVYFFGFDTWFYWLHRWMHTEPAYKLIHKIHHRSTSPNLLTSFSESPLESLVNGGFVPLFSMAISLHASTAAVISITAPIMGLYVHSGYEFFPRWWHKSWATKWFITTTFHDQHHKYFNYNFGGYTTIWDRICGTKRAKFESDYDALKARVRAPREQVSVPAE